jgi:hypothetical protein
VGHHGLMVTHRGGRMELRISSVWASEALPAPAPALGFTAPSSPTGSGASYCTRLGGGANAAAMGSKGLSLHQPKRATDLAPNKVGTRVPHRPYQPTPRGFFSPAVASPSPSAAAWSLGIGTHTRVLAEHLQQ